MAPMPSDLTLEKAERLYNLGRITHTGDRFLVEGDTATWTVTIVGEPQCTCPASTLGHRTCSHVEAVWLEIRWGSLRRAVARGRARSSQYVRNHKETE